MPLRKIILKPGQLLFCHSPCEVSTVLGSCVAVTIHCPALRAAAICHALLPLPSRRMGVLDDSESPFRYVSTVLPEMANYFLEKGVRKGELHVKLFGGAEIFVPQEEAAGLLHVGSANVKQARQQLGHLGLRLEKEHVGGHKGRKIIFNTETGEVLLKVLNPRKTKASL